MIQAKMVIQVVQVEEVLPVHLVEMEILPQSVHHKVLEVEMVLRIQTLQVVEEVEVLVLLD